MADDLEERQLHLQTLIADHRLEGWTSLPQDQTQDFLADLCHFVT